MSRGVSPTALSLLQAAHVEWFLLLELELDSGTRYLTNLAFDIDVDGHTYTSLAGVASVEPYTESDTGAEGLVFSIVAVSDAAVASVFSDDIQDRKVTLKLAVVGSSVHVISDWIGTLDVPSLSLTSKQPVIRVTAEHSMIRWNQPNGSLSSHEDQQKRSPGDTFFKSAASLADRVIYWPAKEAL